ncbi:LytR C-terminal domain-containing protein [candidate division WOR-3 bacterium]|nr:LytR C-terminal domain-containing protein [candidate division WOR-3 bacterium]
MKAVQISLFFFLFLSCSKPPLVEVDKDIQNSEFSAYPQDTLMVEILNGTGKDALGRFVADTLRSIQVVYMDTVYYFDVIRIDNWHEPELDRSFVVDRKDFNGKNAKILCLASSINPPLVELRKNSMSEVTLIVGPDYENYFGCMDSFNKIW